MSEVVQFPEVQPVRLAAEHGEGFVECPHCQGGDGLFAIVGRTNAKGTKMLEVVCNCCHAHFPVKLGFI